MAYTYDDFGNVVFVETEEERRRREEEERQRTVQTQTVETAADGSQTVTTKSQVPAQADVYEYAPVGFQTGVPALQPPQLPVLPVVAQVPSARAITPQGLQPRPINPQEVFRNMVQAESGGQNFDQFGRPLTSPKGAMFANQVMPATAAQPGYGVRPAQAQTAEEFNRVGRDYFSAMLTEFNGDQQKAAAAYNAGPGRIRQAEQMAQQRGGSWRDYIPRETIAYLGRVFERMIPSAQAATLPQPAAGRQPMPQVAGQYDYAPVGFQTGAPVAPTVAAVDQYDYAPVGFQTGVAPSAVETAAPAAAPETPSMYSLARPTPTVTPEGQETPAQQFFRMFETAQDNPMSLMALRTNMKFAEPWMQDRVSQRLQSMFKAEVGKREGAEEVKELAPRVLAGDRQAANQMAKIIQRPEREGQEGSWAKYILLHLINPDLGRDYAADKLGFGVKTSTVDLDGTPVQVDSTAKGKILRGYRLDGTPLTVKELERVTTMAKTVPVTTADGRAASITYNAKGEPQSGVWADGKTMTNEELVTVAAYTAGGPGKLKPDVGGIYERVDENGRVIEKGRLLTEYVGNKPKTYIDLGNGKKAEFGPQWRQESISTAAAKADIGLVSDLKKKHGGNVLDAEKEYVQLNGPFKSPEERQQFRRAYGFVEGMPTAGGVVTTPAPTAGGVVTTPAPTTGGVVTTPAPTTGGVVTTPPAVSNLNVPIAQQQAEIRKGEKREERLDKHITEVLVPAGAQADSASRNIREQLRLFDDPKSNALFGLYNRAQAGTGKEWAIVRDIFAGKLSKTPEELSKDIAALGLNSDELSMLAQYANLNGPLVAATARAVGGAQLSDADRAAAEKLQVDLGRTPALGAFNIKSQQLFSFDVDRAKRDYAAQNQDKFSTAAQLDAAWNIEQTKLLNAYRRVAEQRIQFIKVNSNNQPASVSLVREAYRRYPPPQYDPGTGWRNLRDRDLNQILRGR